MSFLRRPDHDEQVLLNAVFGLPTTEDLFSRCDRSRVLRLADRHFIAGSVASTVLDGCQRTLDVDPSDARADANVATHPFLAKRDEAVNDFLRLVRTYVEVGGSLDDAGVRHLVLKGPTCGPLYTNEFERHSGDLDVLIDHPSDADAVVERLLADGWTAAVGWATFTREERRRWVRERKDLALSKPGDRAPLELHWRASASPREWPHEHDPFEGLRYIEAGGQRIPALGARDQRMYLLHHGAKHGWRRLKWVADMARLDRDGTLEGSLLIDSAACPEGLKRSRDVLIRLLRELRRELSPASGSIGGAGASTRRARPRSTRTDLQLALVDRALDQPNPAEARRAGRAAMITEKLTRSVAGVVVAPHKGVAALELVASAMDGLARIGGRGH